MDYHREIVNFNAYRLNFTYSETCANVNDGNAVVDMPFFLFRFQICERKTKNEFLFRFSLSKLK